MGLYSLIEAAQNKDKQSTVDILSHFHPTIKKLSNGLYYEEAETDLIIVFLELIKSMNIKRFSNADEKQIASFIHKYLKNKSLNLFRDNKTRYKPCIEANYDLLEDKSIPNICNSLFISLLLDSLIPLQREVIVYKFVYGFSDKEIAKQLKVSRQAINRIKNRALNNLRIILTKDGGEQFGRKDN